MNAIFCVSVSLSLLGFACQANARFNAPAPSRAQIEADWLLQDAKRLPAAATGKFTPTEDAAGAVDGIKNGKWGFHTDMEENPWWQVDMQKPVAIDRVTIYNRCDFAERNARIRVLVSDNGTDFRQVYQHDGSVFYGFTDQKPLVVSLKGVTARYLRLALNGKSYFHLEEVEVYPVGGKENAALGKPATQSSTSEWSARHSGVVAASYPFQSVFERARRLAESQRLLGVSVDAALSELRDIETRAGQLQPNASDAARKELYLRAHWVTRSLALGNPLINFDKMLFVKRAPAVLPHMSDQHYGWWSRPGGGIFVMEGIKSGAPTVRCLTSDMTEGSFIGPDISYDGKKVIFAHCKYYPQVMAMGKVDKEKLPEDCFYNLYEMNIDGSNLRRLTQGRYDDFDPRYLPDGSIAFLSTRKGIAVQCQQSVSDATRQSTFPDSYVRCGGDIYRPCAVFTLHSLNRDGAIRPLSAFENFEWTPSVASDGRILYARWDYIDRFNGHFESLWSANQDGTNPQLVYGNYTVKPQAVFEARSIPNSSKLVFTASAHHSITGGSLCLLDRNKGTEDLDPLTRLTPEVCFPETEGSPAHYYANPYPLSEDYFLTGWATHTLPPHAGSTPITDERNPINAMGIYLYDAFGNQELLYRDPEITSMYPLPIQPRAMPTAHPSSVDWAGQQEGRFLMQDVYQGLNSVERGSVKQLRIVGIIPKVQPFMNAPMLGVSAEDPGKFVLGVVPVEEDGSAYFRIPSGIPVFFQALDKNGVAVQTMRTVSYVLPNQTLSCVGCHESRDAAPPAGKPVLASLKDPSRITPGPAGSWPLRYDHLVQPVLDRLCVECHRPGATDPVAARLDLTPARSYQALMSFGDADLKKAAFERDRSIVGKGTAATSKLWQLLSNNEGHRGVKMDADSRLRLTTWLDTYAHWLGHYSDAQEKELIALRSSLAPMLEGP